MRLSNDARRQLHAILLDAYPGIASFALVLEINGRNFEDYAEGGGRREKYIKVIVRAEAGNWVEDLIGAVYDDQDGNEPTQSALQTLAEQIRAESDSPISPLTPGTHIAPAFSDEADEARQSAFERMVRRGQSDADLRAYISALTGFADAACAVEWDGQHQGTGFLIGPRTIITNQHVIDPMPRDSADGLSARFGYALDPNGQVQNGTSVGFDTGWHVFSRPPDPSDEDDGPDAIPSDENLDYAIVRLEAAPDGVAPLPLSPLGEASQGNDITIVHHPNGAPLRISKGRLTAITGENRRLRYDANTKKGSSGGLVCDHAGRWIGLHHTGDPNFSRMASYNQAIMFSLIVRDIEDNAIEII